MNNEHWYLCSVLAGIKHLLRLELACIGVHVRCFEAGALARREIEAVDGAAGVDGDPAGGALSGAPGRRKARPPRAVLDRPRQRRGT